MTLATVGFAVSMLISGVSTSALAGNAFSSYGYYTVGSTTYENQAEIATWTGPNATAWTQTQKSGGGTPNGWAGSRGRLFTSGGSLSCEGTNRYNSGGAYAFGQSCVRSSSGSWYSYGVSLGWNGSGYTSFYTFKSPNQNS
jgi:hypothetical protein